jgi:hypothetical protein
MLPSRPQDIPTARLRKQGLAIGLVLVLLFGVILPLLRGTPHPGWPFWAGGLLSAVALVFPRGLRPLYRLWMGIGRVLAWVNTRLILGLVYFVVLVPVGLVMKLFGHDPLARKLRHTAVTYRVPSRTLDPEQMEKPY